MSAKRFPRPTFNPSTEGYCTKCKNVKPRQEMAKDKSSPDGLHGWCKDCNQKATTAWENRSDENFRIRRDMQARWARRRVGASDKGTIAVRVATRAQKRTRVKHGLERTVPVVLPSSSL